ncbi:hypothetical protein [Geomonas agri]
MSARENRIPVVGLNVNKDLVTKVHLDSLPS